MTTDLMISRADKVHFYSRVSEAIRSAREAQSMTIDELADAAKLTRRTIQSAEWGGSCSALVLTRIAHALDTTLDALVPLEALR